MAKKPHPASDAPKRQTKAQIVTDLLSRTDGATISELTTATGWQAHTVRAALTRLRKTMTLKRHTRTSGENAYTIVAGSDAAQA